jgi:hypothetical protein
VGKCIPKRPPHNLFVQAPQQTFVLGCMYKPVDVAGYNQGFKQAQAPGVGISVHQALFGTCCGVFAAQRVLNSAR